MSLYYINVTLHVLAAMLWLGGMLFLGVVGAPVLRRVDPAELRQRLFADLGRQFRSVGWMAIAVLIVTGVLNLRFRGLLSADVLGSGQFWATPYGTALAWKLGAVALMLLVQAMHDFRTGPRATMVPAGSPEALRLRRHASVLARVSALAGLVVVIAAVRLARGG